MCTNLQSINLSRASARRFACCARAGQTNVAGAGAVAQTMTWAQVEGARWHTHCPCSHGCGCSTLAVRFGPTHLAQLRVQHLTCRATSFGVYSCSQRSRRRWFGAHRRATRPPEAFDRARRVSYGTDVGLCIVGECDASVTDSLVTCVCLARWWWWWWLSQTTILAQLGRLPLRRPCRIARQLRP